MMILQCIQCMHSTDCDLAAAIYSAMGGTVTNGGSVGVPGVEFDAHQNVVGLWWKQKDLIGTISPKIGELKHLKWL